MADIAFLLLVFFMVTSVLKTDADIPLTLPESKGAPLKDKEVMVSIAKNQQFYYNNLPVSPNGAIAYIRSDMISKPDLRVNIQAHKDLNFSMVQDFLDLLKEAGVKNFAMVTKVENRKM